MNFKGLKKQDSIDLKSYDTLRVTFRCPQDEELYGMATALPSDRKANDPIVRMRVIELVKGVELAAKMNGCLLVQHVRIKYNGSDLFYEPELRHRAIVFKEALDKMIERFGS